MLRSEWLLALDEDAVGLAAVGLVRLAGAAYGGGAAGARAFAESWLVLGGPQATGLRVRPLPVLRALAHWTAELLLEVHYGDSPEVLERLGRRCTEAGEEARCAGAPHPAEPVALALVWHAVQARSAEDGGEHHRRIHERCEAYLRDQHRHQDTLALALAGAQLAADTLLELGTWDVALAERAARSMPVAVPAPRWVPACPHLSAD
ncbi:hypothetical protein C7C46_28515 [Streptomyces tateyamensis]|uniref:Uncharacterized protein n=1 Tax=Streptomyces tateyamensis TaxID=565073 RepID=A0A2V4N1N7_9ACTN|nr:hypothetical protein [Streptomyces tateyamensis]PYC69058.1 hypothetical protein C7C46_28515 [Streptomyces tateyamensis]